MPTLSRRQFLKLALATALSGVGGAEYSRAVEPRWIAVEPVALTLPRLAPAWHGLRIVQLSDLHLGDWLTRARLDEVVTQVNALQPDLIAITGDFVTGLASHVADDLIAGLRPLRAPLGVVAVMGNHDHWANVAVIRQVLRESGILNLSNGVHTLQRGGALLHIAGVDSIWARADRLDQVLARLPTPGAAILLAHEPDFADTSATTGRFDLQLSGHSHGGQVVVPGVGPLRLPDFGEKYPSGRYQVGPMIQYTNRGIGMVRPHVRFNCRPEITVLTLAAPA